MLMLLADAHHSIVFQPVSIALRRAFLLRCLAVTARNDQSPTVTRRLRKKNRLEAYATLNMANQAYRGHQEASSWTLNSSISLRIPATATHTSILPFSGVANVASPKIPEAE